MIVIHPPTLEVAGGGSILEMPARLRKRGGFFRRIHWVFARRTWIARNSLAGMLAQAVKTIYTASCRLKRRRSFAGGAVRRASNGNAPGHPS